MIIFFLFIFLFYIKSNMNQQMTIDKKWEQSSSTYTVVHSFCWDQTWSVKEDPDKQKHIQRIICREWSLSSVSGHKGGAWELQAMPWKTQLREWKLWGGRQNNLPVKSIQKHGSLPHSQTRSLLNRKSQPEVESPSVKKGSSCTKGKFPLKQWFSNFRKHLNCLQGL